MKKCARKYGGMDIYNVSSIRQANIFFKQRQPSLPAVNSYSVDKNILDKWYWTIYYNTKPPSFFAYNKDTTMQGKTAYIFIWNILLCVSLRWSRARAVEYMLNHTFITSKQAHVEVDRYITWPGQACAYKFGEIQIKRIRRKAETELGTNHTVCIIVITAWHIVTVVPLLNIGICYSTIKLNVTSKM